MLGVTPYKRGSALRSATLGAVLSVTMVVLPVPTAAVAADTASISGEVRNSAGVVQSAVDVALYTEANPYTPTATTQTGAGGEFSFANLGPAKYQVLVSDNRPNAVLGSQFYNPGAAKMSREYFIALAAGESRNDIGVTLYRPGTQAGEIICSLCDIPNTVVRVEHRPAGSNSWELAVNTESGWRNSSYLVPGILPGEYRIVATNIGDQWRVGPVVSRPFTYTEGQALPALDVVVRPDRVIRQTSSGLLQETRGNGAKRFVLSRTIYSQPLSVNVIADPGEFDGDGIDDVIVRTARGNLALLKGQPNGSVSSPTVIARNFGSFSRVIAPGDVTGDGNSDILAQSVAGALYIYPGTGRGTLGARFMSGSSTYWAPYTALSAAGDLVMNQYNYAPDLVARSSKGTLYAFAGRGDGTFARSTIGTGASSFTDFVATGDFDGNYYHDFLGRTAAGSLHLFSGDGTTVWKRSLISTRWGSYREIG